MRLPSEKLLLRDGREVFLRSLGPGDAAGYRRFLRHVRKETDLLLETSSDPLPRREELSERLLLRRRSPHRAALGVFGNGRLLAVGTLSPYGTLLRVAHRGTLSLAVRQAFWDLGIGSALLSALIRIARAAEYAQVELSVDEKNERAIRLYQRFGFSRCGHVDGALRRQDGSCSAEETMVLRL